MSKRKKELENYDYVPFGVYLAGLSAFALIVFVAMAIVGFLYALSLMK